MRQQPGYPQQPQRPGYQQPPGYPQQGQQYAGGWPSPATPAASGRGGGVVALVTLVVGALLALGYAGWAVTARRGIFADFSDGTTVTVDDAKSSDKIDTLFLIVAGVVVLIGLLLWVIRLVGKRARGGVLGIGGLVVCGLGVVIVAVGLFLAGKVANAGGLPAQGDKGVTATLVIGAGFVAVAVGLLLGSIVVRGGEVAGSGAQTSRGAPNYQNW